LFLAVIISYVFFSHNSLFSSKEMTEGEVDFLFFFKEQKEIVFLRTDLDGKISYVISFPSISYEPILAISTDLENPRDIYGSVEKLFGTADMGFYAVVDKSGYEKIVNNAENISKSTQSEDIAKALVATLEEYEIGFFDFLFFSNTGKVKSLVTEDNFDNKSVYRLLHMIKNYAMKFTPLEFLTIEPVKILKYDDNNTTSLERLYMDENGLKNVKEFMEK